MNQEEIALIDFLRDTFSLTFSNISLVNLNERPTLMQGLVKYHWRKDILLL